LELSGLGYPDTVGRATDVPAVPDGRAVLVGAPLPAGWADRVETRDGPEPRLVRPDGYVTWTDGPGPDTALRRWFGPPGVASTAVLAAHPVVRRRRHAASSCTDRTRGRCSHA
jgi:hypothetical protein